MKPTSINRLLLHALCASLFVSSAHALKTDKESLGFFGAFGAVSVILSFASNHIAKDSLVKKIARYTNTNAKDLVDCATLSTLCWGSSYLPNNRNIQYFLRFTALGSPFIQILATSQRLNRWINKIPLVNMLLDCRNPECKGICNQCKLTALYKKVPFELAYPFVSKKVLSIVTPATAATAPTSAPIPAGGEEEADECPVCLEDEMDNPVEMCTSKHRACKACALGWKARKPICPVCRAPMLI